MQVMSEFDASNALANTSVNGPASVTVDAEWSPERRSNMEFSQVIWINIYMSYTYYKWFIIINAVSYFVSILKLLT